MAKYILMFAGLVVGFSALAATPSRRITLTSVENPSDPTLPIASNPTPIPCDQIVASLNSYSQMVLTHEQSLTSFLTDVGNVTSSWYTQLQPLEGQTLPTGTTAPIQDGSNKITQITNMAYQNSSLLADQLSNIITSLGNCSIK